MNEITVQRNYKDSIFRMLFKDKENLLSLYNALNKTNYTDVSSLEITTLENAVYMNYKNDLYDTSLISVPSPRFVVFYNGTDPQPENQTLRLSDSYEKKQEKPELELAVTVYNINLGCNEEIMNACRTLKEYAMYVERVRTYAKQKPLAEAVKKAVDECIAEGILSEFLRKNRAEAIKVSIYEYDEELHFKTLFEHGREEGLEQGERRLARVNQLYSILLDLGRLDDLKRATADRAYQEQLIVELLSEEMEETN